MTAIAKIPQSRFLAPILASLLAISVFLALAWPFERFYVFDEALIFAEGNNLASNGNAIQLFGNVWRPLSSGVYEFLAARHAHQSGLFGFVLFLLHAMTFAVGAKMLLNKISAAPAGAFLIPLALFVWTAGLLHPSAAESWFWCASLSDEMLLFGSVAYLWLAQAKFPVSCMSGPSCRRFVPMAADAAFALCCLLAKEFFWVPFAIVLARQICSPSNRSAGAAPTKHLLDPLISLAAASLAYLFLRSHFHGALWMLSAYGNDDSSPLALFPGDGAADANPYPIFSALALVARTYYQYASNAFGFASPILFSFRPNYDPLNLVSFLASNAYFLYCALQFRKEIQAKSCNLSNASTLGLLAFVIFLAQSIIPIQGHVSADANLAGRYFAVAAPLLYLSIAQTAVLLFSRTPKISLSLKALALCAGCAVLASNGISAACSSAAWTNKNSVFWEMAYRSNPDSSVAAFHFSRFLDDGGFTSAATEICSKSAILNSQFGFNSNVRATAYECAGRLARTGSSDAAKSLLQAYKKVFAKTPSMALLYAELDARGNKSKCPDSIGLSNRAFALIEKNKGQYSRERYQELSDSVKSLELYCR